MKGIITLCGSTKFKKEYEEAMRSFTMEDWIVLTVGLFGHADNIPLTPYDKAKLDRLHKNKIDISQAIFVINKDGYIGDSTKSEIMYARMKDKQILWLEPANE